MRRFAVRMESHVLLTPGRKQRSRQLTNRLLQSVAIYAVRGHPPATIRTRSLCSVALGAVCCCRRTSDVWYRCHQVVVTAHHPPAAHHQRPVMIVQYATPVFSRICNNGERPHARQSAIMPIAERGLRRRESHTATTPRSFT